MKSVTITKGFFGLLLAGLLLAIAVPAFAQASPSARVGIIDINTAQEKFEYLNMSLSKLENDKNSYQALINEEQQKIQELQKKRESLKGANSTAEARQLTDEIDKRMLELKSYRDKSLHDLQVKGEDLDNEMREKFKLVIEDVAKSLNLDLVIEKSIVLYSKDDLDITEIVITELNKRYPASLSSLGGLK